MGQSISKIDPTELAISDKLLYINRVAKVVKGGKRLSFSALVVAGDGNGHVGIGLGKAREVTGAIAKGTEHAKKNIYRIPLIKGTIPHSIVSKFGAGKVLLKPASPGTGVIAGGPVRAICEAVGIQDILTKSIGSSNPHNVVKATMDALLNLMDASIVARKRGITMKEVFDKPIA